MKRVHRLIRGDIKPSSRHIPVEDHVQVLVGRNPLQQLVGDGLVARLTGVAMRDAGRQLLERHIDDRVEQALGEQICVALQLLVLAGGEATSNLLQAQLLELDGIDCTSDDEVVAQRDAVPVLLGGPAVDPEAPWPVHAEVHRDFAVIGRQIVLRQEVGQHRHLGDLGQLRLLGIPVLAAEGVIVLAVRPRNVVMGIPVLAHRQVAIDVLFDDGLEFAQQLHVG